jgi:large subunit ribosomal protein L23
MKHLTQVIKKPLLTEKASALKAEANKVAFKVDMKANKIEIKKAVESLFDVKVTGVATMIFRGKPKRVGKSLGRRDNWKKAVVSLEPGTDLDVFGVEMASLPEEDDAE